MPQHVGDQLLQRQQHVLARALGIVVELNRLEHGLAGLPDQTQLVQRTDQPEQDLCEHPVSSEVVPQSVSAGSAAPHETDVMPAQALARPDAGPLPRGSGPLASAAPPATLPRTGCSAARLVDRSTLQKGGWR